MDLLNSEFSQETWAEFLKTDPIRNVRDIRFQSGQATSWGYLGTPVVDIDGTWGNICKDNIDENTLNFLCRKMGYKSLVPEKIVRSGLYNGTMINSPVFLNNIKCIDNALKFHDCTSAAMGFENCESQLTLAIGCIS